MTWETWWLEDGEEGRTGAEFPSATTAWDHAKYLDSITVSPFIAYVAREKQAV